MSLPMLRLTSDSVMQSLISAAAANGVGALTAAMFAYWQGHYFGLGSAFALSIRLILLVLPGLIALSRIEELAAIWQALARRLDGWINPAAHP
jgi:hypothetical protein